MSAIVEPRAEAVRSVIAVTLNLVDAENPWLGLDSFTEETRHLFHGREEEIAELSRRVQRKLLAVLFGQSGLGKTSILRAGIVPRLRREGFCPVYVRIDYSQDSPAPSEQIKQAIFRATESSGRWTKPGAAVAGESLWEFLHHRGDVLQDGSGAPLVPLLIFDQFEEIFTLAQDDDFGRERAAQFVDDLADLVENRLPKALEVRLEHDESVAERFDFSRADYRVMIALREDYLAHLEGLKRAMPAITQNRMRLARMTGAQALAAVVKPGGKLVSEEVAEAIVRFVAGGAELRNAEVEPSLLSLVCRELNNARVAQGRAEISADVLAGSHDQILHEFYERALADQPAGVRHFIEDGMLTESGFRESLAEERVQRAFAAAGAPAGTLATLVNRRLLRIEERLDMRRVELTHDVLCTVVRESRDRRHEREARDEAERQLEAQKARETATRKALVRARQVAAACAVLAIGAVGSALFGYQNMKRAQEAEAKAQQTREMAQGARGEAERLIVYLLDDFYLELEPIGRLDIVAALAKRALDYYAALPPELRTAETDRNRALALVRYGFVLRYQAKLVEAEKVLSEATTVLARLQSSGDRSEVTAIGLALGNSAYGRVLDSQAKNTEALAHARQAADVLGPLYAAKSPSIAVRRAYGTVLTYLGFMQMRMAQEELGAATLELSRAAFRSIDDLKLTDLPAASAYAEASGWYMEALVRSNRKADAKRVGEEARPIARQVLERRPGHMGALRSDGLISAMLGFMALDSMRLRESMTLIEDAARDWEALLKLDPDNAIAWGNLIGQHNVIGFSLERLGRPEDSIERYRRALEIERRAKHLSAGQVARNIIFSAGRLAVVESDLGNLSRAEHARAELRRITDAAVATLAEGSFQRAAFGEWGGRFENLALLAAGDHEAARARAAAAIRRIEAVKPGNEREARQRHEGLEMVQRDLAWAAYNLRDYAAAEAAARHALASRQVLPTIDSFEKLDASNGRIILALAIARQGRRAEALAIVEPELKFHRELMALGKEDYFFQQTLFVRALLAAALASPSQAPALLAEAAATLDGFPQGMTRRKTFAVLRGWIADEMKSPR